MSTLFRKNLTGSGNELLIRRAALLEKGASNSVSAKINELEQEINLLNQQEAALCDMGPETQDDLKPGKNFNADTWRDQLFHVRKNIMLKEIDLEIYKGIQKEFFTEITEPQEG